MALFIIAEGFAWWSSWPLSVNSVLFIIRREIGVRRGSPLFCSMELLLQVINLSLHGFIIISPMEDVASPSKAASTSIGGMYSAFLIFFPISFTFEIEEIILLMKVRRFRLMQTCLMWSWSYHIESLYLLMHKFSPQTAPIVGSRFLSSSPNSTGSWPNEP